MARILSISSQVVFGPVGNTAAVPAMQALGHEVLQIPTVLLSNHPGHGAPTSTVTDSSLLLDLATKVLALTPIDAVMTGYFVNAAQVEIVSRLIKSVNPKCVLIDPVIGDHGKLYVAGETASAIRDHLLPLATITTPNIFELGWLTSRTVASHQEAVSAARTFAAAETIVTSLHHGSDIETVLVTQDAEYTTASPVRDNVPNGTGDFLAGLYLAHRILEQPETAFRKSMTMLNLAIDLSAGKNALAIAAALRS